MKKMIDRANDFALNTQPNHSSFYEIYTRMYMVIATEQRDIDIEKIDTLIDEFHDSIRNRRDGVTVLDIYKFKQNVKRVLEE